MNFSWIESYFFETDGVGLVLTLLPFAALMFVIFIDALEKNGGKK